MPDGKDESASAAAELRRRAEEKFRKTALQAQENIESLPPDEANRLFYELRVHQIELEMQNEELRRSQAELEASRARYFDLYDLAPVGYVTISEDGLILEANLTAAELLGADRSALAGQPFTGFVYREDQDVYYLRSKKLFETGEPQGYDLRMLRRNESHFWTHFETTAARDAGGATLCLAVLSDISGQKRLEEAIKKHQDHLEEMVSERTEELTRAYEELKVRERQLTLLSRKVITSQEQERISISRDLHDTLGQRLVAMSSTIRWLEKRHKSDTEEFHKLSEIITETNQALQRIYKGLRPMALDKLGLEAAVESLVWDYRDQSELNIKVSIKSIDCKMDYIKEISIYRILQEALTNIVKHSEAGQVEIYLRREDRDIILDVVDDGIGFNIENGFDMNGFGVAGMRERAALCKGTFDMKSEPEQGTRISVRIPVHGMQKELDL